MRHEIHEIHFGDDHSMIRSAGSFAPLNGRKAMKLDEDEAFKLHTHEYILKVDFTFTFEVK